jgi:hypothetical protein
MGAFGFYIKINEFLILWLLESKRTINTRSSLGGPLMGRTLYLGFYVSRPLEHLDLMSKHLINSTRDAVV